MESVVFVEIGFDTEAETVITLWLCPQLPNSDGMKISRSDTTGFAAGTLACSGLLLSSFVILSDSSWVNKSGCFLSWFLDSAVLVDSDCLL